MGTDVNTELKGTPMPGDCSLINIENYKGDDDKSKIALAMQLLGEANTLLGYVDSTKMQTNLKSFEKGLGIVGITGAKEKAVSSLLGLTSARKFTFFHSGFNVAIKRFELADTMALDLSIADMQVKIGMDTIGVAFSNDSAMIVEHVVNSLRDKVSVSTLKSRRVGEGDKSYDAPIEDVFNHVSVLDMHFLMCSALRTDIDVVRTCSNIKNDKPCDHTISYSAEMSELVHANLDEHQGSFMCKGSVTLEEVEEYQDTYLLKDRKLSFKVNDIDTVIEFKVPSVNHYIECGKVWLDRIISSIDRIMMAGNSTTKRTLITHLFNKNKALAFTHFIGSVKIGESSLSEVSDIIDYIELLDEDQIDLFITNMQDFVKGNTIATVAIPAYKCPSCEKVDETNEVLSSVKDVVSLNMVKVFLDLTNLKLLGMAAE